jgi:hypothetical protein
MQSPDTAELLSPGELPTVTVKGQGLPLDTEPMGDTGGLSRVVKDSLRDAAIATLKQTLSDDAPVRNSGPRVTVALSILDRVWSKPSVGAGASFSISANQLAVVVSQLPPPSTLPPPPSTT